MERPCMLLHVGSLWIYLVLRTRKLLQQVAIAGSDFIDPFFGACQLLLYLCRTGWCVCVLLLQTWRVMGWSDIGIYIKKGNVWHLRSPCCLLATASASSLLSSVSCNSASNRSFSCCSTAMQSLRRSTSFWSTWMTACMCNVSKSRLDSETTATTTQVVPQKETVYLIFLFTFRMLVDKTNNACS